jgi:DNA-binding MarR family transcriptional regulator
VVDIQSMIADHRTKKLRGSLDTGTPKNIEVPTTSEIPDLFFDQILINIRLSRVELVVLMYIYRKVWCRPNLYKVYGISQIMSHNEMAKQLNITIEQTYQALRKLEELNFISTIRSGQYFVRKYFTQEYDEKYGQNYDDFEI